MPLTAQVLIALVAGLALGLPLAGSDSAFANGVLAVLGPVGTVFINAIRMTVIPLVVSSLISGVTGAPDPRVVGRIGARAMVVFVVLLVIGAAYGVFVAGPLIAMLPLEPAAIEALRASAADAGASAAEGARSIPSVGEWLVALVPPNPIKAAVDGAMLPVIVASVAFGAALIKVAPDRRAAVTRVVDAVMEASLALVRAILVLAPVGVFALAVPLAARMGTGALGAILGYVVIVTSVTALFAATVLYPAAVSLGKVPLRLFAKAALPAQSIAVSSRSSLAALPAMLESVRDTLRLPPTIGSFLIPLSATLFRAGAGVGQTIGVIFVARLYGVDLSAAALLTVAVTAVVTSFSVPGIPGGSIVAMVPVLMAAHIPVEGIGILLGADTIPDMVRTTTNVTGQMAAAVVVSRGERDAH